MRRKALIVLMLLLTCLVAMAESRDSLFRQIGTVVAQKIIEQERKNEQRRFRGLPEDYVVYITESDFPANVYSLKQQQTLQSDVEKLWDFKGNPFLQGVSKKLQEFSAAQQYGYYIVVCAIYNLFELDEATNFLNITWSSIDRLRTKENTTAPALPMPEDQAGSGQYRALLHYLVDKFKKEQSEASSQQGRLLHFVLTTYVPDKGATEDKPVGRLRHLQGLCYSSPHADPSFNTVWESFYKYQQAELGGRDGRSRKGSKEEWLSSFITHNQEMLAAIRNIRPDELMAITDAAGMLRQLKHMPEAVMAGFSVELRIHILQVLSGVDIGDEAEAKVCALLEQAPLAQADEVINAMRLMNPRTPEQVWSGSGGTGGAGGTLVANPKRNWCLLQCLTEQTEDAILGIWYANNYQRLIKAISALCYKSPEFNKKAKQLNDSYLDALSDKIPDRVIFYSYHSIWAKISTLFKPGPYTVSPQINWSTKYNGSCQLQTRKELFIGYFFPNTQLQRITLDPFEPVIFENRSDLGLLADFSEEAPQDHILPAIILKYADDKGTGQTLTDVTMAAIDLASLATGYGELKAGISGMRKAWVLLDMSNAAANLLVKAAAYDNPRLQDVLNDYNLATGAVALSRMATGVGRSVKSFYAALKSEPAAMNATAIRDFLRSVKEAGADIKQLKAEDAALIESYLSRIKAEANARGLANLEQSADEGLLALKGVQGAGRHANWVEILDIRNKINLKVGHVIENLDINSAGTKFTGCHSEISLRNHIAANPTSRYEFRNPSYDINSGIDDASRVFEAKPVVIKADGSEMIKGNNQGVSTFFPKNWDTNKILDEVEHAITNNHGRIPEKPTGTEYFGFSKDGKVEIHFYLNADASIGSYFPRKR